MYTVAVLTYPTYEYTAEVNEFEVNEFLCIDVVVKNKSLPLQVRGAQRVPGR